MYLDELTPLQQSWYRTGARAVNGRDFARSVAIRQPSAGHTETTVFNLGRHYRQLRFAIGLWDDSDPALQSRCQVVADQQVIYDSGTMTRGTSAEVVRDVSESFDLTISCTPTQAVGADGEVVLADAQLTAKPGQGPRPPRRSHPAACGAPGPQGGTHARADPVRQDGPVGGQPVQAVDDAVAPDGSGGAAPAPG